MTYFRLSAALGGLLLLVTLVSCSDPSGVGLGVGEDPIEGGDPEVETITPDTFYTDVSAPTTGLNGAQQTWRFLAGAVSDYGRVRADGYFDIQAPTDIPTPIALANPDSLNATLRLQTNYVHGDTSAQVPFQLHDLTANADMDGAPADSSFPIGAEIASYSRSSIDSLITFSLPNSWVQDNADLLRDTSRVGPNFHGFRLSAPDAEAVVGFEHETARLELSLAGSDESVTYLVEKSFSQIERPSPPSPPTDHVLIQDGTGDELVIEWNRAQLDSLRGTPLNRAAFIIPTNPDTTSLGESFVRPSPDYRIAATREEGAPSCGALTTFALTSEGDVCGLPLPTADTGSEIRVDERASFPLFERLLLQDTEDALPPTFSEYRTRVVDRPGTPSNPSETIQLGLPSTLPVLIPTPGPDTSAGPRVELTVTPL
jgi:hypothetical protein